MSAVISADNVFGIHNQQYRDKISVKTNPIRSKKREA